MPLTFYLVISSIKPLRLAVNMTPAEGPELLDKQKVRCRCPPDYMDRAARIFPRVGLHVARDCACGPPSIKPLFPLRCQRFRSQSAMTSDTNAFGQKRRLREHTAEQIQTHYVFHICPRQTSSQISNRKHRKENRSPRHATAATWGKKGTMSEA